MATPFTADQPFKENNVINESEQSVDPTDDEGKLVQLEDDGKISQDFLYPTVRHVYDLADSPATWTKDAGLKRVRVQAWGGGGSGTSDVAGGGGGGGGYFEAWFEASELGATEIITIGDGGASVSGGSTFGLAGSDTTFGSLLTAYGALRQNDIYSYGHPGGEVQPGDTVLRGAGSQTSSTSGGVGLLFGGGGGGYDDSTGGSALYGGAGGSGSNVSSGSTSKYGGDGGGAGVNGSVPGGGGGGSATTSGAGGAGRCIVTEYYS